MTLTLAPEQVYALAYNAGFRGADAVIATAVAMAESGNNPDSVGDKNLTGQGEVSVGLWQINYRPWRDSKTPYRNPKANRDPIVNAQSAFVISGGKNFRPWSTFMSGAYQQYVPAAHAAQQVFESQSPADQKAQVYNIDQYVIANRKTDTFWQTIGGGIITGGQAVTGAGNAAGNAAGSLLHGITAIPDLIGWITDPKNVLRIGMVLAGFTAIVLAILILSRGAIEAGVSGVQTIQRAGIKT